MKRKSGLFERWLSEGADQGNFTFSGSLHFPLIVLNWLVKL
ncbi:hypothetical protein SD77_2815 [Bacillus badius]|uniref:Mobile element protein n=1 Tax=Bacillus badius TaxID=1455 RepID=A0ABR5APJ8_BACBA|nr:hypothetical protein SD77_2815 [Bacillus badius]